MTSVCTTTTLPSEHYAGGIQASKLKARSRPLFRAVICLVVLYVLRFLGQAVFSFFVNLIGVWLWKSEALWEEYLPVPLQIVTCAAAVTCCVNSMWKFIEEVMHQIRKTSRACPEANKTKC